MLTGKQKIEAAFSEEGSKEFAAVDCWEYVFVRDHWDQLTAAPWYDQYSPDIERQASWRRDVLSHTEQDLLHVGSFYSREERANLKIEDNPEGVFLIDKTNGKRNKLEPPAVGGWSRRGQLESVKTGHLPTTEEELDAAILPLFSIRTNKTNPDDNVDLAHTLIKEHGSERYPIAYTDAPLWHMYELWGFEGMMLMIGGQPELVKRACPHFAARTISSLREAALLGAAGILIWECFTDLISPEAYESYSVPYMRQVVDECRRLGLKSIYGFSGDPAGKLDAILSIGADALAFEESKKDFVVDINELAKYIEGRCCLFGNLDAIGVLQNGSEDQLKDAIAKQIAAGRRNRDRFVVSLGSPVTPAT
ncbi:MAG: uroporphyrinogen decarboxylase family protein [Deltaproteobacteria bacterium]|nr:uroporphyrinogen decarboxylase family protein [Deltaproteobacteria bacterium]